MVAEAIGASVLAMEVLAGQLKGEMAKAASDRDAETLASMLLEGEHGERQLVLRKARTDLQRRARTEEREAAIACLCRTARVLAPALQPLSVVTSVRDQKDLLTAALISVPAGTHTRAEVIMAAVERSEAEFRARRQRAEMPPGLRAVPLHPECGFRAGHGPAAAAVSSHLQAKLAAFHGDVHGYLAERLYASQPGAPQVTREQRAAMVADRLAIDREAGERSYYLAFFMPADAGERAQIGAVIQELKDTYRDLVFIVLDHGLERLDKQELGHFRSMLPLCAEPVE